MADTSLRPSHTIKLGMLDPESQPRDTSHLRALSVEMIELISDFLFHLYPPASSENVENQTICCAKPPWHDVEGFMYASPELHRIGFIRWTSVLTIRTTRDWDNALNFSHRVKEMVCLRGVFLPEYKTILSRFPQLRAVCIESHEDVRRLPVGVNRFAYQDIFTTLPQSLRHLEIRHAHGPGVNVITRVKKHCPNLETLWLGRCTMFNCSPACQFWESFPFDHDSYISIEGTDAYANWLGQQLSPLQHLTALRLGIYFMPSTAVLAHRVFHAQNLPAPPTIYWRHALAALPHADQNLEQFQNPQAQLPQVSDLISLLHRPPELQVCGLCWEESFAGMQLTEESANRVLKKLVPGLQCIEWMDWFTPSHLGVSSCWLA